MLKLVCCAISCLVVGYESLTKRKGGEGVKDRAALFSKACFPPCTSRMQFCRQHRSANFTLC